MLHHFLCELLFSCRASFRAVSFTLAWFRVLYGRDLSLWRNKAGTKEGLTFGLFVFGGCNMFEVIIALFVSVEQSRIT